ncbi:cell division protein FtsL [Bacillus salacetis]|uniref:Cell division protein FtsL n=1 Tax=Bacillus salacetis TaxID=2315464 RepID=A0A3A1R4E8_9BACI|nr:cell division protein FtsL [Bacillus salacetis]RIW36315.1 cell division protein FtsL [Bacillus salacetis]
MSNLARNYREQTIQQPQRQQDALPVREGRRPLITPGEKILAAIIGVVFCFMAVNIISTQSSIYKANKDIQVVQSQIEKQEKANTDLTLQISELSTYERILEKAKELGLDLKEKNVKVVQSQ